jgi:N-acetylglucosamine-6-phosphate deacetylase
MKWKGRILTTGKIVTFTIFRGCIKILETQQFPGEVSGAEDVLLFPGLIDIQVNGCNGVDYSGEALVVNDLPTIIHTLGDGGVTRHLPTIITNSFERVNRNLQVIAKARNELSGVSDSIPGIHIEGPYIASEEGPRGAHDSEYIRDPNVDEFAQWQDSAGGAIKMITLAPERKGALKCIEKWSNEGVVVALGHTAADPGCINEAVAAGAALSTHLGNGSHKLLPRLENYLWEQLASDKLYASLICDGDHLSKAFTKTVFRAKKLDRCLLISDITALAGSAPGMYLWGKIKVEISETGRIGLAETPFLAGAGHDLLYDINYLLTQFELSLQEILPMCTSVPAKLLGLRAPSDELINGVFADYVIGTIDPKTKKISVKTTLFGESIFEN